MQELSSSVAFSLKLQAVGSVHPLTSNSSQIPSPSESFKQLSSQSYPNSGIFPSQSHSFCSIYSHFQLHHNYKLESSQKFGDCSSQVQLQILKSVSFGFEPQNGLFNVLKGVLQG